MNLEKMRDRANYCESKNLEVRYGHLTATVHPYIVIRTAGEVREGNSVG